jgi:hypothetical protein
LPRISRIVEWGGRLIYGSISISLGLISLTIMVVAIWDIWTAFSEKTKLLIALLDSIGLIVIAMAVFDVSKFLLEEEVFRIRDKGSLPDARGRLTKFLAIIAVAVSLEALVFIFTTAKQDISKLIYPTFLLIAAVMMVVSLGIYQKLSREAVADSQK